MLLPPVITSFKDTLKTNPKLGGIRNQAKKWGQIWGQIRKGENRNIAVNAFNCWWSHLGSNQGPTDYESATLTNTNLLQT